MGRKSTKINKNMYQTAREALEWSREYAAEQINGITADRIEKIESGRTLPYPEEVVLMAKAYKSPYLMNRYCACQCAIGKDRIPEIESKDLHRIVIEMLVALNSMNSKKDRLLEIALDGQVDEDQVLDFLSIQKSLNDVAESVESLRLWFEQMVAEGKVVL